jgi:hypothetical protein
MYARNCAADTVAALKAVGVPHPSPLSELYIRYGWTLPSNQPRYELLSPVDLEQALEHAREAFDVADHFVPLTSCEGDGYDLLDLRTGMVYVVSLHQLDDLESGRVANSALTQVEYIRFLLGLPNEKGG